jgi:hypothetical protein
MILAFIMGFCLRCLNFFDIVFLFGENKDPITHQLSWKSHKYTTHGYFPIPNSSLCNQGYGVK